MKAYADAVKEYFSDSQLTCLQKVPLKSFLKSLLCKEIDGLDELLESMGIDEAEIGFNHWTSLLASKNTLCERGVAEIFIKSYLRSLLQIHCFQNAIRFHVINHIIPFKYNAGYGTIISIQNKMMFRIFPL